MILLKISPLFQKCKTIYEQQCKPSYKYGKTCKSVPKQVCNNEQKCSTTYSETCQNVPRQQCSTTYSQKCENIPKNECKTTYTQKCEKYPKQLCTTNYRQNCVNVPQKQCKNVKHCNKIPEEKCWTTLDMKCKKIPQQKCKNVPKKNCWKVSIKKNRYVKKKHCQRCKRNNELYYVKSNRQKCNLVPRQDCRTLYVNSCTKVPHNNCKTVYTDQCSNEKKCITEYEKKCTKPKPSYKPSYNAPKEQCENVPKEKCWNQPKCTKVPSQSCKTEYRNSCKKVPQQKCTTVKDLKCKKYTVDVPNTRVKTTCHWPGKQQDRWCTRRSDYDIFLDDGSEYSSDIEYIGKEMDDEIDYLEVFPADYAGSPNETKSKNANVSPIDTYAGIPLSVLDKVPGKETGSIDLGNLDYTFPAFHNTSGVIRQVEPPVAYGKLYQNHDAPTFFSESAQQPAYPQAQIAYSEYKQSPALSPLDATAFDRVDELADRYGGGFFPENMAALFQSEVLGGFGNVLQERTDVQQPAARTSSQDALESSGQPGRAGMQTVQREEKAAAAGDLFPKGPSEGFWQWGMKL